MKNTRWFCFFLVIVMLAQAASLAVFAEPETPSTPEETAQTLPEENPEGTPEETTEAPSEETAEIPPEETTEATEETTEAAPEETLPPEEKKTVTGTALNVVLPAAGTIPAAPTVSPEVVLTEWWVTDRFGTIQTGAIPAGDGYHLWAVLAPADGWAWQENRAVSVTWNGEAAFTEYADSSTGLLTLTLDFDAAAAQTDPVFTVQPVGGTAEAGGIFRYSWTFEVTPDSAFLEILLGDSTWNYAGAADGSLSDSHDGETRTYRVSVVIGSETFSSDPFTVAWQKKELPVFLTSPVSLTCVGAASVPLTWTLSADPEEIWVEQKNPEDAWFVFASPTNPVVVYPDTVKTFRLAARFGTDTVYSDEFTLTCLPEPEFTVQPADADAENGAEVIAEWAFSDEYTSARLEYLGDEGWMPCGAAESPLVLEGQSFTRSVLRVVVTYYGSEYFSECFIVEWSEKEAAPAFVQSPASRTVRGGQPTLLEWQFSREYGEFYLETLLPDETWAQAGPFTGISYSLDADADRTAVLRVAIPVGGEWIRSDSFTVTWGPLPAFTAAPEGGSVLAGRSYRGAFEFNCEDTFFLEWLNGTEWVTVGEVGKEFTFACPEDADSAVLRVRAAQAEVLTGEFTVTWVPAPEFRDITTARAVLAGSPVTLTWSFSAPGALFRVDTGIGGVWTTGEWQSEASFFVEGQEPGFIFFRVTARVLGEEFSAPVMEVEWVLPTVFTLQPTGGSAEAGAPFAIRYGLSAPCGEIMLEKSDGAGWAGAVSLTGSAPEIPFREDFLGVCRFRVRAVTAYGESIYSDEFEVEWTYVPHFVTQPEGGNAAANADFPIAWSFSEDGDAVLQVLSGSVWLDLGAPDAHTVPGAGRDDVTAVFRVAVTVGEQTWVSRSFTVVWALAPKFTVSPPDAHLDARADYPFTWQFNFPVEYVILQIFNNPGWSGLNDVTETPVISGQFNVNRTYTYRLCARSGGQDYFSPEFTVTWDPVPAFTRQPSGGTCENGKSYSTSWSFSLTPDSAELQMLLAGDWIDYGSAAQTLMISSSPDRTISYRIVITYRGEKYFSDDFTVTWQDSVRKYQITKQSDSSVNPNNFSSSVTTAPAGATVSVSAALRASDGASFSYWYIYYTDPRGEMVLAECTDRFSAEASFVMPEADVTFFAAYVPAGEIGVVELTLPVLTEGDEFPDSIAVPDGCGYRVVRVDEWYDTERELYVSGIPVPHPGVYEAKISFTETDGKKLGYYYTVKLNGEYFNDETFWETSTIAYIYADFTAVERPQTEPPTEPPTEEPTEPPTEPPTEAPTAPEQPTDPGQVTEEPTQPVQPTQPAEPTERPSEPTTASEVPTDPRQTAAPTDPEQPTEPAEPTEPEERSTGDVPTEDPSIGTSGEPEPKQNTVPWVWIIICAVETLLLGAAAIVIYLLWVSTRRIRPRK